MLSFTEKVLVLFIWNVAPAVYISATVRTGKFASQLPDTLGVINISDTMHSFYHDKSSSISQLINGKSGNLRTLLKCFNGTTTSAFNVLLSFGDVPINFV